MPSRKWFSIMVGLAAAMALSGLTLLAVSESGVFELDGNAISQAGVTGEDWQDVNALGYLADGLNGHAIARTGVVADMHDAAADPTAFFNKQTKDTVDLPGNWTWKATSVPDKDDIDNAYAAAYVAANGHTIITFGADRFSAGNGDAFLGFWFFQANVGPVAGGTFSGQHTPGDLLVLVNFQGGGSTPNIQILKWVESGGDVATNLLQVYSAQSKCGDDTGSPACAITNDGGAVDVYWPFAYKNTAFCSGPTCSAPKLAFFEGAVDLNQIFGDNLPCITSFLAETRSSSSVTADLKDFVAHSFELCGIGIGKTCGTATATGSSVTYVNNITVANTGRGTLYDALVTDTYQTSATTNATRYFAAPGRCGTNSPCTEVAGLATLAPKGQAGDSVTFQETFSSTLLSATDTASVVAAPASGAARTVSAGPFEKECGTAVTPKVEVTKNCDKVELVALGTPATLQVKVTVSGTITNKSTGTDITLTSISDDPAVASITLGKTTLAVDESTTFGPFSYFPSAVSIANCTTGNICFTDVVTVDWSAVLGGATGSSKGQATCHLCDFGCASGSACQPTTVVAPAVRR